MTDKIQKAREALRTVFRDSTAAAISDALVEAETNAKRVVELEQNQRAPGFTTSDSAYTIVCEDHSRRFRQYERMSRAARRYRKRVAKLEQERSDAGFWGRAAAGLQTKLAATKQQSDEWQLKAQAEIRDLREQLTAAQARVKELEDRLALFAGLDPWNKRDQAQRERDAARWERDQLWENIRLERDSHKSTQQILDAYIRLFLSSSNS